MSKMAERAAIIAQLEDEGYSVTPPRDEQYIWETSVGLWLQSFQLIQQKFERHEVTMSDRSEWTLDFIRGELAEMLTHAKQESEAA